MDKSVSDAYIRILKEELIPAMGCTEPIAVAYAAAYLRDVIGGKPERIVAGVSGNILKNVKSVIVPNTGNSKGVKAAVAAGVAFGDAKKQLEVIAEEPAGTEFDDYMASADIEVECLDTTRMLDIVLTGYLGNDSAMVEIANSHTNIVKVVKNGEVIVDIPTSDDPESNLEDKSVLSLDGIIEFADTADITEIAPYIKRQRDYNSVIANEGITGKYGAAIGKILMDSSGGDILTQARAYAAAGSDARMSGCEMPVIILSGSGNQGITASVPVVKYGEYLGVSEDKLLRAMIVSDLVTVHQKTGIGRLSAYCGSVSAGTGAACGIAYLDGASADVIKDTVINAVAIISGTVCDGAKPSCAAKIASSIEAGLLGYKMAKSSIRFHGGDGIVWDSAEDTIASIGTMAREGMRETDKTILNIMLKN